MSSNKPWYDPSLSEAEAANTLCGKVTSLRTTELSTWRRDAVFFQELYAGSQNRSGTMSNVTNTLTRYNVVKAMIDTAASFLTAARTLPFYETRGAEWSLRHKARNCNQVLQSQFQEIGVFEESQQVVKDAIISRLGVLKFFQDPTKNGATPSCKRMLPLSVLWDPAEAVTDLPSTIYQIGFWDKDQLASLWPKHKEAIEAADGPSNLDREDFGFSEVGKANQVVVYEGWHLPSSAEADDGFHFMCVPGAVLVKEAWKSKRFPFAFLRGWEPEVSGLAGQSLVQHVMPHQQIITDMIETVTEQQKGSNLYCMLYDTGGVTPEQVDNTNLKIFRIKGAPGAKPPEFHNVSGTPMDLQQQIDLEVARCQYMLGLSSQQIQGQRTPGIDSAIGLRTQEDIQSKRHVVNLRYIEQYYTEASECLVDVNRAISSDPKVNFKINYRSRKNFIEQAKWTDVDVDGEMRLAVLPISQLVGSPAAQFEQTQEWVRAGWCDQNTAKILASQPDTEGQANSDTEDTTYAYDQIEDILDSKQIVIDPYQNVEVLIRLLRTEYLQAKRLKAPEPILTEFRRVLDWGKSLSEASKAKLQSPVAATIQQAASASPVTAPEAVPA